MGFSRFLDLAPELRLKIFSHVIPSRQILALRVLYAIETGFTVAFDFEAATELPLITSVTIRGLTQTCRDLRKIYLEAYPDHITLSGGSGGSRIHIKYDTTIIYLPTFHKLVSTPSISHALFDRNSTSSPAIRFPEWFCRITHLALTINCIIEYPEACPHPFSQSTLYIESALFAKMLRPFENLCHLSAVPDPYWHVQINFVLGGYFRPHPIVPGLSVLGKLAERKEQLSLWAEYKNFLRQRKEKNAVELPEYVEPELSIWGREELEIWDYL